MRPNLDTPQLRRLVYDTTVKYDKESWVPDEKSSKAESEPVVVEQIEVDALFLANSAEVREGFLYALGGGWIRCWPHEGTSFPFDRPVTFVMLVRVPYHDANIDHRFSLFVLDEDRKELAKAEGTFKVGRDLNLTPGMSQLVPFAGTIAVKLPRTGIYQVVIEIGGVEKKRIAFEVLEKNPKSH